MDTHLLNIQSNQKWFADNGNYTHAVNYNLNEESMVIDLGGYKGLWADIIIDKYNSYITILEPIKEFYDELIKKFKNNSKIKILNYGISTENKIDKLYLNGDSTSMYIENNTPIEVEFITIHRLLDIVNRDKIDLVQINIEGEEYKLLDEMLDTGTISKFDNIQVQFHTFVENAFEKRLNIQQKLEKNNFVKKYDYPFVFEGWFLNSIN